MESTPGPGATGAAGAANSPSYATVDIDLGNTAKSGHFTIAGTFDPAKTVVITQGVGPYTGKGTLADEAEMDGILVVGEVRDASTLECFWHATPGPVRGHFNFQYRLAIP